MTLNARCKKEVASAFYYFVNQNGFRSPQLEGPNKKHRQADRMDDKVYVHDSWLHENALSYSVSQTVFRLSAKFKKFLGS